jgi:dihydrofolate reductase
MRKIVVYIATSADGYIARSDGGVEWLDRPEPEGGYGGEEFGRTIDTVIWGRTTYDFAMKMGGLEAFGPLRHYVFSRRGIADAGAGVEVVSGDIAEFAERLRGQAGKNIWMMGGASIIGAFLDAGAIDEFSIHVMPVMIGDGIRLVAPGHRNIPLELISTRAFPDGVVHLNYRVGGRRA